MGVLDSSYIKSLGVKWPCLKQILFYFCETLLDTLKKVEGVATMVKALDVDNDTNIDSENSWDDLDTCCPKSGKMTEALAAKIEDHLERIPCDLPPEVSA